MFREAIDVSIELCHPEAKMPRYARTGDAGMDVGALEDTVIEPGETVVVRTGIKVAIPEGFEIQVRPRSGLSLRTPLRLPNSPGTIDAGYRDEVGVLIQNTSTKERYTIKKGERIAQLILSRVPMIRWKQVESVAELGEDRGGGFGSSGR